MVTILPPKTNIGSLIGQGLGSGIAQSGSQAADQQYQRGQLEQQLGKARKIFEDPNATFEQKQLGLYQALSGRPDIAKHLSDQLMQSQEMQSKQQQFRQKQDEQINVIRAIEKQRNLPEGSLDQFISNPQLAASITRPQGASGGVTAQPVPPEISQKISDILSNNPDASAEDLQVKMAKAGVPPIYSNSFIETRRRDEESKRQRELESEKQDYQSFKDNSAYIEKVLNGYEAYKRDSEVLDEMNQLIDKGELPTPLLVAALGKLGLPLGILQNPDAEQFEKLSQELLKNIQGTYGNRILQSEVASFLKSIPGLLNSEEGKKRLVRQWKLFNEGKRVYYDAYKELRADPKYEKRLPPDLHEKVIDRAEPKLDSLSKRFKNMNKIPDSYRKSPGMVLVVNPNGEIGEIEENYLQDAIKEGYDFLE